MQYTNKDHTFVICAYKESRYLEECIRSLETQSIETKIILATSTPNELILSAAHQHGIPVFVNNTGKTGIAGDWNFALSCVKTPLATIAHQDDIYEPDYVKEMLKALNRAKDPILFSSGYGELRNGKKVYSNTLLNVKKVLRLPMRLLPGTVAARRLTLAFGDPICCPSVTYVKARTDEYPFSPDYRADLDWQQWERLSKLKGSFAFCAKPLMCHRIHEESETSSVIGNTGRGGEDYEMFRKFWPEKIAAGLANLYAGAEKSNDL